MKEHLYICTTYFSDSGGGARVKTSELHLIMEEEWLEVGEGGG
jgi:hypothetical protein